MAFDPSVIGSIGDTQYTPADNMAKAASLRDMLDRNQMNSLALNQQKEEAADSTKIKAILSQSDYTTPQGLASTAAALNRISPKASMDMLKWGAQYQSGQLQHQMDQYDLAIKKTDIMAGVLEPIVQTAREMKAKGASDLEVNAYIAQQTPGALQTLRQPGPDGKPVLADEALRLVTSAPQTLQSLDGFLAGNAKHQAAFKNWLDQHKLEQNQQRADEITNSLAERERHDRAMEASAKAKEAGFTDTESNLLAALADKNVSLPAGLRSQVQIKSTVDGLLRRHPELSADEIAEGIKSGKLKLAAETKGAQTAGTQIGKVALAANELESFGDQTMEASAAVPRGKFVPYGELRQKVLTKDSDPALLRFKAKMQALENAYNQLAARSGTDVEKRAHIHELFNTANSDEAVRTLVTALKEEAAGARDAANRTSAETSGSAIPGAQATGGAGTPAGKGNSNIIQHPSGATIEILSN
jgi:hypothetical protein